MKGIDEKMNKIIRELKLEGEEPRWQRNRTGRPLSLLQIHGKNH